MGVKEELGKKIKRMRLNRGLTQEQLAEAVDVSQRTLSGIEIGENFVTAETLACRSCSTIFIEHDNYYS